MRGTLRVALTTALVFTVIAGLSEVAHASGPANDNFVAATIIAGGTGSTNGTTVGATTEADEPATCALTCSNGPNATVWYAWKAPSGGTATFDTCANPAFDTMMAVYKGSSLGSLTRITDDNDASGCGTGAQSRVSFTALSGVIYRVQVDGFGGATGTFTLTWNLMTSPGNDNFAAATAISGSSGSAGGTVVGATTESGEPATCASTCSGGPNHTVWYSWTAPSAGTATFDTCANPAFDTMVAVYTGSSLGSLARVTDDNDASGCGTGAQSRVSFSATSGTTYRIQVDGAGTATGVFTLTWNLASAIAPPNDNFASATAISGSSGSTNGTTVGGTTEPGEPATCALSCSGGPNHTVWYAWTAPSIGTGAIFNTCANPNFDTMVAVYTGSSLGSLARVADSNDYSGCGNGAESRASFPITSGTTYRIQVDGFAGATGTFTLTWKLGPPPPPPNDAFANATFLDLGSGSVTGTTLGATTEPGEPATCALTCSGGPNHTVWYALFPPGGTVTFDTCSTPTFDTMVAVYTSQSDPPSLGSLTRVTDNNDSAGCGTGVQSRVSFLTGGTEYWVQVDGAGGATGTFTLTETQNDSFANAEAISGDSGSIGGTTAGATAEPGEPATCVLSCSPSRGPNHTVWYAWTAPKNGTARFDTCSTGLDTLVAVYKGSSLGSLTRVGDNDDSFQCGSGLQSRVSFTAASGTTYRIQVDVVGGDTGTFFGLTWDYPPKNDSIVNATAISGVSATINSTNLNATAEYGEPCDRCLSSHPGPYETVWYKWTAPSDGSVTVGVCSTNGTSPFVPVAAIYTGSKLSTLKAVAKLDATFNVNPSCGGVAFTATSGTPYRIQVDDSHDYFFPFCACPGPFTLTWNLGPLNDYRTNVAVVTGSSGLINGTTVLATAESLEPASCAVSCSPSNGPNHTVWYGWAAPADGTATFDTCANPAFDTTVAVYTSDQFNSLTRVTDGNDSSGCGTGAQTRVSFTAASGRGYWIQVDGFGSATGTFTLTWSLGPLPPPPNDSFSGAVPISGQIGSTGGSNGGATAEAGEPATCLTCSPSNGPNDTVWYSWTAPKSGTVTIDTCAASFDTMLAVYTGPAVGSLLRVTDNDDACGLQSRVTFPVTFGTTYRIQVDGWSGATGTFTLTWSLP